MPVRRRSRIAVSLRRGRRPSDAAARWTTRVARGVNFGHGRANVTCRRLPLFPLTVDSHGLRGLQRSPRVVGMREDVARRPRSAAPCRSSRRRCPDLGWTGTGSAVAIVDTGIDVDHPLFGSRLVA
ncbi:MAG: hypothetical protein M3179_01205 [Actinomycetota bacterium]|nr:hypothetical protein [Actinomycetota bacterium]